MRYLTKLILLPALLIASAQYLPAKLIPQFLHTTCEGLQEPLGLDSEAPTFSWTMQNTGYDQSQSAYRILVATRPELLKPGKADVWDSKKVNSRQSANIPYGGPSLFSKKRYWWTVRVWNQDSTISKWAEPRTFEMGLLNESDWNGANWISLKQDTRQSPYRFRQKKTERMKKPESVTSHPVAWLRREFDADKKIQSARAYVCALGYYELYLNGKKVGNHVLDPAPTTYPKRSLYVTYDITDQMTERNIFGLILTNGFYGQNLAFMPDLSYGVPAVRILVDIVYDDGSQASLITDSRWKATTGPIVFDNVYGGETYDARYAHRGWDSIGFDDAAWQPALVVEPDIEKVVAQTMPPSRRTEVVPPKQVFRGANGNWIVDFGKVLAGWVRISPTGPRGHPIIIRSVEALTRSGDAIHPGSLGGFATGWDQEDIYICSGEDGEKWEPRFTYNSFRYVEVEGLPEKPAPGTIEAILVHSDVKKTGSFHCSDPLLNKMVAASELTVLDNLHGYPEDCPAREKCGWLGDAHATAEFNLYSFDIVSLFEKYAYDIQTQLKPANGHFTQKDQTFMVPTMIAPGKRTSTLAKLDWGIAEIYVPWYVYLHTGNRRSIDTHYTEMKDLVGYYLTFKDEHGIIQNGMGDWCPPRWDRRDNPEAMECDPITSANAYFYDILGIMSRIASMQNDSAYKAVLDNERAALRTAFNKAYLISIGEADALWYGSQTGTVMALQFGMVNPSVEKRVVAGLLHDIINVKDRHHATGIHGNRHIYTLLNDLGYGDLSQHLLTTPEFPSQAYIINAGMTTWPERQWEWASGIEWDRSLNHPMQAGFAAMFYESLAGIRPDPDQPGYRHILFKPTFWKGLEEAGARIGTPHGPVTSEWQHVDGTVTLAIEIPFNSTGTVDLPVKTGTSVSLVRNSSNEASRIIYPNNGIALGSGEYLITFSLE